MKCEEIFAALELLEKERGIPQDFMMGKIIQALTAAYKKDHEGVENVIVDVNEEKKDLRMYVQKEIVEEVENPGSQISLEDARAMSAKYQLGGVVNIPVKNVEFGRIAAGNGKQVIIQGLREAERGQVAPRSTRSSPAPSTASTPGAPCICASAPATRPPRALWASTSRSPARNLPRGSW